MKWRVRGVASLFIEGVVEASSAEEAKRVAQSASTSTFEWFIGGGTDVTLGNNRLDAWPETLEAEPEPETGSPW